MSHPNPDRQAADRAVALEVRRHHAHLAAQLREHVDAMTRFAEAADVTGAEHARRNLLTFLRRDLVPHALAEEQTLYPAAAARPSGARLVEGMLGEHRAITDLVDRIGHAPSPIRAATAAHALAAVFDVHLAKENDLVLPLLVADEDASLAGLLAGMHELLGGEGHGEEAEQAGCGCGEGGCGGEAPMLTVDQRLDVRTVPHDRRHALVLSTVEHLGPGEAVVLVAGHAPRPVLAEVYARFTGQVRTEWLQEGPTTWQVRLERVP